MISSLPIYIGTLATFVATHFLASFVSSIPRREGTARLGAVNRPYRAPACDKVLPEDPVDCRRRSLRGKISLGALLPRSSGVMIPKTFLKLPPLVYSLELFLEFELARPTMRNIPDNGTQTPVGD